MLVLLLYVPSQQLWSLRDGYEQDILNLRILKQEKSSIFSIVVFKYNKDVIGRLIC